MMEQIPYACGRLGELAQDIRWCAGQLPALREAGGAAELRQIAQQIQKLASALHEAALLLEELDLPRVSAYTAQLLSLIHICYCHFFGKPITSFFHKRRRAGILSLLPTNHKRAEWTDFPAGIFLWLGLSRQ